LSLALTACTTGATTFTLDTTLGAASSPISATAEFTWSGNTLGLRLSNTTASIDSVLQELTGITFVLSGAPSLQAVSGSSEGSVNCVGVPANTPCTFDSTPVNPFGDPVDLSADGTTPTGWAFLPSYALFTFAAGNGSFQPYAIVNDRVVGTGGTSGARNNPLLLGPVDFQFVFGSLTEAPMISGVQFYWGTGGDHRSGVRSAANLDSRVAQVPEPSMPALLGLSLLAMFVGVKTGRRVRHARVAAR
jgi:hypothetical protein